MGGIIKFIAGTLLVLLLLALALPLLWLVAKLFAWVFGGLFGSITFIGGDILWILITIVSIIVIIWCISN